jgi:hypothetical protein
MFYFFFSFFFFFFLNFCYDCFSNLIFSISSFNIRMVENLLHNLFFIFNCPFYTVNVICRFVKITQVILVYGFGGVSFF